MNLEGLIGAAADEVTDRLGPPDVDRTAGEGRWMVYRRDDATLRVRCAPAGEAPRGDEERAGGGADGDGLPGAAEGTARVASWTLTYEAPRPTLRRAVEPLGLWPACAPDVRAGAVEGGLVRRPLPDPSAERVHSLTAGLGPGGFARVAAFDEPPEWT